MSKILDSRGKRVPYGPPPILLQQCANYMIVFLFNDNSILFQNLHCICPQFIIHFHPVILHHIKYALGLLFSTK
jgi:hypothetical protein